MRFVLAALVALVLALASRPAWAHKPSDSYVTLTVDGAKVSGRWDISVRDLEYALDLDADGDGRITWGELRARHGAIAELALGRLSVGADGQPCPIELDPAGHAVTEHSDGSYAVLRFTARCPAAPATLGVGYRLLFDLDPQHRGLLRVDANGATRTHTFSAGAQEASIDLRSASRAGALGSAIREGILHIWHGYDHVLFLFALLLPSVLRREKDGWRPVEGLRPALGDVLRIVTAFTVAHSITLTLAALDVVTLPSRLVESAIAASVVLAALNNLRPVLRHDRWAAAFLLGLMHGFGFSATLKDLDLPRSSLLTTLFGFNVGVEIGQLAIVLVFVPLAFAARRSNGYRRLALIGGSAAILALATVWLVERAFAVRILS